MIHTHKQLQEVYGETTVDVSSIYVGQIALMKWKQKKQLAWHPSIAEMPDDIF
jgi:hypothetical protein